MGLEDRSGLIWMDGEYVEWREAKVHVLTHTLHYGMGCFEGVRALQGGKRHRDLPARGPYPSSSFSRRTFSR